MCSHGTPRRFRTGHALGGRVGGKARRFFAHQGSNHSLLESRVFYWRVLLSSHLTFVIACNESPSLSQRSGKRSVSDVRRPIWIAQNHRMTLGGLLHHVSRARDTRRPASRNDVQRAGLRARHCAKPPARRALGSGISLVHRDKGAARPDRLNRRVADMDGARCSGLRSCQPLGLGWKLVPPGPSCRLDRLRHRRCPAVRRPPRRRSQSRGRFGAPRRESRSISEEARFAAPAARAW